jgi:hypothetical protein
VIMTKNNDYDVLEEIVSKAHQICNRMLLFEAIEMEEDKLRLFLECNNVSDHDAQNTYLGLVREYEEKTTSTRCGSGRCSRTKQQNI